MVITPPKRGKSIGEANGRANDATLPAEPVDETSRRLRELFASGQLAFDSEVDEGLDERGLEEASIAVTHDDVERARAEFHRRRRNG